MKLIKIFSEHTGEETRLYSVPRFQKEFNSKAQKELRRRLDLEKGLEYSKLDPTKEYPLDIVDEGIRRGRSLNSQSVQTKNLKERAKELKKAKRIKFLKKGAKATAIGIGTVGIGVGIKKAVDNHKEKKLLKEYREQLKTYSEDKKKDVATIAGGIASGTILGAEAGKRLDIYENAYNLKDFLYNNPQKMTELSQKIPKSKQRTVMRELSGTITPKTIRYVKKGAKLGAITGGTIATGAVLKKSLKKEKKFSSKAEDWNKNDDKYVGLIEKAERKNQIIGKHPERSMAIAYATPLAVYGAINGYKRGSLYKGVKQSHKLIGKQSLLERHPEKIRAAVNAGRGALVGVSMSQLGNHMNTITGLPDADTVKKASEKDTKTREGIIKKYKNMKSKEDRDEYRKKLGLKF